jgi:hypothetical protein
VADLASTRRGKRAARVHVARTGGADATRYR